MSQKSLKRPRVAGLRTKGDARGFTLIETLIAIGLFSVVLLSSGQLLTTLARGGMHARTRTVMAFHMQSQIEQLHEGDYASVVSGSADTTLVNGTRIRAQWTVTQLVPGRLAQVDVTVKQVPAGPGGREQAARLFIANRNP